MELRRAAPHFSTDDLVRFYIVDEFPGWNNSESLCNEGDEDMPITQAKEEAPGSHLLDRGAEYRHV